ncbi:dnaJ homolog subfamily C member 7-like [Porites lutea]|uniref:dnaJ homolog subfamily C member 7-like n=1 Tax=Porites lutea TaxID=51062 RepID=UPI003CC5AAF1
MADGEQFAKEAENLTPKEELEVNMDVQEGGPEQDSLTMAEAKKAEGNKEYAQKHYEAAVKLYSEAIELAPSVATYYGNRSAAFLMLVNYDKALEDARAAIKLDDNFVKGYYRAAKCHLVMGSITNAANYLQKVIEKDPKNKDAQNDLRTTHMVQEYESSAFQAHDKGDYRKVVFCMNHILEVCPACNLYKVMRAEAYCLMGKYSDALTDVQNILRNDSINSDALYVKGLCLYYQDFVDKAYQHFNIVLRNDPDHKKARIALKKAKRLQAKKQEGNDTFSCGKYQEAYDIYTEALTIDAHNNSTNAKLYYNRSLVGSKLNRLEEAINDCTQAIELDPTYLKAYIKRARCYMEAEKYEEAVRDYEKVCKMDRSREHRRMLEEAKFELKKSKRKDYYKILGISKGATEEEIKKAYKKEALKHHPDRHSGATDEVKKSEELLFKEVNEAYSVLSDPRKKARYDSGQDLEDGFMNTDFDPNSIFQAFFGGPGFGGFNFGGPGGGPGGFSSSGFPGGFQFTFG